MAPALGDAGPGVSCPTPLLRDPHAFEAGLAAVPGWGHEPGTDRVEPVGAAGPNASFKVTTAAGAWLLRIAHDPALAELLGVDAGRERALQRCAAAAGLAPSSTAADSGACWQLRPWIEGRVWQADDFDRRTGRQRIAQTLRQLHAVPPPPPARVTLDPMALAQRWVAQLGAAAPSDAIDEVRASLAVIDPSRRPTAIVHSDVHPGNVIDTGQRLWLIDWEYAQVGDPLCDLAAMLAAMPALDAHAVELLELLGLAGRVAPGELEAWTRVYRRINSLWQSLAWAS
jgi:thiamine kinase